MNILGRISISLFLAAMLASCNSFRSRPTITLTPTQTVTSTPTEVFGFDYTVQRGDSLEALAQRFNLGPDGALLIYNANREVMEANNGIIFVGQTIRIPPPGSVLPLPTLTPIPGNLPRGTLIEYSVLPGDTLASIAARFNSLEEDIIEENEIENANALQVGQILQIPVNLVTPTAKLPPASTPITPTVPGGTPTSTRAAAGTGATPAAPDSTLFLADAEPRDLIYRFTLFDVESKELKTRVVDFSTKNWDAYFTQSGFNSAPGSQFVHYNPLTREIVFVLFSLPSDEGMAAVWPPEVSSDPAYRFEIYKTAFDSQNEFVPLYIGAARTFSLSHTVLYPPGNALFVDAEIFGDARHPEIQKFDIGTGQFEHIANPVTSFGGKSLTERSDLRLSPDGKKLYQLLRYRNPSSEADPNGVFNQTLYLMTIDLDDRSVDYQEIITGDNIAYGIRALSADGNRIAVFTRDGEFFLWVKDLSSEQVKSIPIPGEVGNTNIFMSNDGKKILVGMREGSAETVQRYWEVYDLNTDQYQAIPMAPRAWDSSGRYLAGLKDDGYIIYDMETLSVLDIGLPFPDGFELRSVQWR